MIRRPPDILIGENYLARWYLIPRNRFLNLYLHRFRSSDDDRAKHDHPWYSVSILLNGTLVEFSDKGPRFIPRWWPVFRTANFAHRLVLLGAEAWTLFITGPRIRDWGFHCPKGWVPWQDFTSPDGRYVGKGCGE